MKMINNENYFLFKFIPDLIFNISFNTDGEVKCSLVFIILHIFLKSSKSKLFIPTIGYLSKKGIIFSEISFSCVAIFSGYKCELCSSGWSVHNWFSRQGELLFYPYSLPTSILWSFQILPGSNIPTLLLIMICKTLVFIYILGCCL